MNFGKSTAPAKLPQEHLCFFQLFKPQKRNTQGLSHESRLWQNLPMYEN